jgi:hypothetical protein
MTGFSSQFCQLRGGIAFGFSGFGIHITNFGNFEKKMRFFKNFVDDALILS